MADSTWAGGRLFAPLGGRVFDVGSVGGRLVGGRASGKAASFSLSGPGRVCKTGYVG